MKEEEVIINIKNAHEAFLEIHDKSKWNLLSEEQKSKFRDNYIKRAKLALERFIQLNYKKSWARCALVNIEKTTVSSFRKINSPEQRNIYECVAKNNGIGSGEISRQIKRETTFIIGILGRLESRKLIRRDRVGSKNLWYLDGDYVDATK